MSNSVAEFFSKKGVKKFKNGIQAFAQKQAVKAAAVSMVLATAFAGQAMAQNTQTRDSAKVVTAYAIMEKGDTLCSYQAVKSDSASFARLGKLVNNATKSQTGREVLQEVSKQGTTLYVDFAGKGTVGFFDPSTNSICLNPIFDDGNLQSCLVHEGKHSIQSAALNKSADCFYDFASNVMKSRVMEADAVATQTKFSYEMARAGDSLAWKELAYSFPMVTSAFTKSAEIYGENSRETMKETMLAWYKDKDYVRLYDESMAQFHAKIVTSAPDALMKDCFKQTMSADSLLKYVCTVSGKPYAGTDGSILKTPQTAYLASDIYQYASEISNAVETRTGRRDDSADGFYILNAGSSVSQKTYGQQKEEKAQAELKSGKEKDRVPGMPWLPVVPAVFVAAAAAKKKKGR